MERATEPDRARGVRIRAYRGGRVHDVKRRVRVPADADLAAFLKRCALAALPEAGGTFRRADGRVPTRGRWTRRETDCLHSTGFLCTMSAGARDTTANGTRR